MPEITLKLCSPTGTKEHHFKQLVAVRRVARRFLGWNPVFDRWGVACGRGVEGFMVEFQGVSFEELFPSTCEFCLKGAPSELLEERDGSFICAACLEKYRVGRPFRTYNDRGCEVEGVRIAGQSGMKVISLCVRWEDGSLGWLTALVER